MKKVEKNEGLEKIVKAVYKSILKTLQDSKHRSQSNDVVNDILDANYIAEVSPHKIPPTKESVMLKNNMCEACGKIDKSCKCPKSKEKGVDKLKKFVADNKKPKNVDNYSKKLMTTRLAIQNRKKRQASKGKIT